MTSNNFNLPEPLYKALCLNRRRKELGRISNTDLIAAPLPRILKIINYDVMNDSSGLYSTDASENLWSLLGQAVHSIVEKKGRGDQNEVKKTYQHKSGATLVTISDYYNDKIVTDWKVTSVYSFLLGIKQEWIDQLNVIKYIFDRNDMPVEKLRVCAILRDWVKSKTYDQGYPQIPFKEQNIQIMEPDKLEEYVDERVKLHLDSEKLIKTPELIPQCSEAERWTRPTQYAVKANGVKTAKRVLNTMEEAEEWIRNNTKQPSVKGGLYIETRKGIDVKCQTYCDVSCFCKYYKPTTENDEG